MHQAMSESRGGQSGRSALEEIVDLALSEDLGDAGDITSQAVIPAGAVGAAVIITRESCTVSGMAAGAECVRQVDSQLTWLPLVQDSQSIPAGAEVARLDGPTRSILAVERTILNFLSHLSGIATTTSQFMAALAGLQTRLAATRKTIPGLRLLEKQAVADGGGQTHRLGLYDAVLIKDNHIAAAGSVEAAIEKARHVFGKNVEIEVEVDTIEQLQVVLRSGAGRVLLDNMTAGQVLSCVEIAAGRIVIEVSGGVNLENVRAYAETGADLISVGALTLSAPAIDFSLEVRE